MSELLNPCQENLVELFSNGSSADMLEKVLPICPSIQENAGEVQFINNCLACMKQGLFPPLIEMITERERMLIEQTDLAAHDALTGLYNRRSLFEKGNEEMNRAKRYGRPLSVLMLDIDHFKGVNDEYGHLAGDEVLKDLANILTGQLRMKEGDFPARYGGEEFVVVLPETDKKSAMILAERLRGRIEEKLFKADPLIKEKITASIGVAELDEAGEDSDLETFLGRADKALYEAKESGRNQVKAWSQDLEEQVGQ